MQHILDLQVLNSIEDPEDLDPHLPPPSTASLLLCLSTASVTLCL